MHSVLLRWKTTKSLVIIKSSNKKIFCAGGDMRKLFECQQPDREIFMKNHYRLDYLISTYQIPFVTLMDGLTMGGGAGLAAHGMFSVATENTVFSMPETKCSMFPDCGFSYVLPRLSGQLGRYLGLTGDRLKGLRFVYLYIIAFKLLIMFLGRDVLYAGLATHYCESALIGELEAALMICRSAFEVEAVLSKFCPIDNAGTFSLEPHLHKINDYFSNNTLEGIFAKLKNDHSDWSRNVQKVKNVIFHSVFEEHKPILNILLSFLASSNRCTDRP